MNSDLLCLTTEGHQYLFREPDWARILDAAEAGGRLDAAKDAVGCYLFVYAEDRCVAKPWVALAQIAALRGEHFLAIKALRRAMDCDPDASVLHDLLSNVSALLEAETPAIFLPEGQSAKSIEGASLVEEWEPLLDQRKHAVQANARDARPWLEMIELYELLEDYVTQWYCLDVFSRHAAGPCALRKARDALIYYALCPPPRPESIWEEELPYTIDELKMRLQAVEAKIVDLPDVETSFTTEPVRQDQLFASFGFPSAVSEQYLT